MGTVEIACIAVGAVVAIAIALVVFLVVRRQKRAGKDAVNSDTEKAIAAEPVTAPAPQTEAKAQAKTISEVKSEPKAETKPAKEAPVSKKATSAAQSAKVRAPQKSATVAADSNYIYLQYNKSFKAKLIQAKDEVKEYYNEIKNFIAGYKKVSTRISWKQESVNYGRSKICRLVLRGKSLYVYLPLDPNDYVDTKYKVEHADSKRFEELPCLYRIKNTRRVKYATELIATVMERYGIVHEEKPQKDFVSEYPYEETLPLIERGLIKVMRSNHKIVLDDQTSEMIAKNKVKMQPRGEVRVQEANELMTDEEAAALVKSSTRKADTTKKGIINLDMLSQYFADGDTVTLEDIKKRVPGFNKKITFVKVLARGVLNKKLVVEADEFSVEAQKMIFLTGGQVIKTLVNSDK